MIISGHAAPGAPSCDPDVSSGWEPNIAADPLDPRHLIVTWWNLRFDQVGTPTSPAFVAVSRDGGASWRRVTVGAGGPCRAGESYADLWPSIGPDGTAYLAFEGLKVTLLGTDQLVSRSSDGGLTWSSAQLRPTGYVFEPGGEPDQPRVTADPSQHGVAYDVWEVQGFGHLANGQIQIARTTDAGGSWSAPQSVYDTSAAREGLGSGSGGKTPNSIQLHVLPNHSLLMTFEVLHNINFAGPTEEAEPNELMAVRSTDDGRTWSPAVTIARASTSFPHDPDTGNRVRGFLWLSSAVAPDGTAYVTWQQIRPGNRAEILLSSSTDGGASWSQPRAIVSVAGQAWSPTLAVMRDGTIGLTWYDSRHDHAGDGHFTTDVWFAQSHDHGESFSEQHLAGPFDYETAYNNLSPPGGSISGLFLGDYFGLTALPDGFAAVFGQARPQAHYSNQDIFFARIRIARPAAAQLPGQGARNRPRLWLSVSPRRTTVGRATRFLFRVSTPSITSTAGRRATNRPVSSATIRFVGRTVRTDRLGRAWLSETFHLLGRYRATATKNGYATGAAVVRVRCRDPDRDHDCDGRGER